MKVCELERFLHEQLEVNADVCVRVNGKVYDIVGEDPDVVGFGHYICLEAVDSNDFSKQRPWTKHLLKELQYDETSRDNEQG